MKERDEPTARQGLVQVDAASWGICPRGRHSPRKTPFVVGQVSSDGCPQRIRLRNIPGLRKRKLAAWASRHLDPGTTVQADGLACLPGLTETGCRHQSTRNRSAVGSLEVSCLTAVKTILGTVKQSLAGTCHALDGKHLRRYLAKFGYRFNHHLDLGSIVPRVFYAAVWTAHLPYSPLTFAEVRW